VKTEETSTTGTQVKIMHKKPHNYTPPKHAPFSRLSIVEATRSSVLLNKIFII